MLAVTGQEADRIRLKIHNDRTTPIFWGYERGTGIKPSFVGYSLICY